MSQCPINGIGHFVLVPRSDPYEFLAFDTQFAFDSTMRWGDEYAGMIFVPIRFRLFNYVEEVQFTVWATPEEVIPAKAFFCQFMARQFMVGGMFHQVPNAMWEVSQSYNG